jgi:hypothetical protein
MNGEMFTDSFDTIPVLHLSSSLVACIGYFSPNSAMNTPNVHQSTDRQKHKRESPLD